MDDGRGLLSIGMAGGGRLPTRGVWVGCVGVDVGKGEGVEGEWGSIK